MLADRQTLWSDIYHDILDFVLYNAVTAIEGPLRALGDIEENEYGEQRVTFDETIDNHIDIDFPPIVVHSLQEEMTAITQAAAYINDGKLLARLTLTALGENDIDEILDRLYPKGTPTQIDQGVDNATDDLAQAAQDMRAAIEALREAFVADRSASNGHKPNIRLIEVDH